MPPLSPQDRARVGYHLGYLNTQPAASIQFGIPRPIQTEFLLQLALNNIIDDGYTMPKILQILGVLDGIECRLQAALDYLPASKLGSLEIRADHPQALEIEYNRWQARLADILGVTPYPYSQRSQEMAGVMNGNLRVRRN